jgi:adenylate cyclase
MAVMLVPLCLALAHATGYVPIGLLSRLDAIIYDVRLRASMPQTLDRRIVIVDIDEKSLAEVGRWPWPRNKLAALTDVLFLQQHVAALGFDVVFAEPDDSSRLNQLTGLMRGSGPDAGQAERFEMIRGELDNDAVFSTSLKDRPVVLGYYFTSENNDRKSGVLPAPIMPPLDLQTSPGAFLQWRGYGANIRPLAQAAPLAGFINSITEQDGIVRALPLVAEYNGSYYESLSLAMFRQLTKLPQVKPDFATGMRDGELIQSVVLSRKNQRFTIPVDRGTLLVPYRGKGGIDGGSFTYVSASDVLTGKVAAGTLSGKIVLLGITAPGIVDLRATPVGSIFPGVEVHANVLSGLLDRRFLIKPDYAQGYEVVLLLILGLTMAWVLPSLGVAWAMATTVAAGAAVVALSTWLYLVFGLVLPLASQLFLVSTAFAVHMSYGYWDERRAKRRLIQRFGSYVPPELVREMLEKPGDYTMQARNQELTVMFCDMRGFTRMSEDMEPVALQQLLNQLFSELTRLIRETRGTVDKYMGDCVMAFWGAPVPMADHARLAVQTALKIDQAVKQINLLQQQEDLSCAGMALNMGIGLNTGDMCVGDMGSDIRRSYTVIGNAVNVGSRLEGLSKVYGVSIVAGEKTRDQAPEYVWQELDRVRVKGPAQSMAIFSPLVAVGDLLPEHALELRLWQDLLSKYRAQAWNQCDMLLEQLQEMNPGKKLYKIYTQRVAMMREKPFAPDWDGATNFETK